jgi:hypothetical protein
MAIISPLTYTITNGQAVDAVPLMADLNQIVSNVNANAAALAGSSSQVFNVANATTTTQAAPLGQIQAGSANYAVDIGTTANAYVVTLTPGIPTTIPDGFTVGMYSTPARANTGAATLNGIAIVDKFGNAIQPGSIVGTTTYKYSSSLSAFIMQNRDQPGYTVSSITSLRGILKVTGAVCFVTGYYATGDGGGGEYYYDSTDTTSADNGGTIIVASDGGRWKLIHNGTVSIKQFGAHLDGSTNDIPFISAAISAASTQLFRIWCPAGTSYCATTLIFPNTIPEGFNFKSHPDFTISCPVNAVSIDSAYHAKFTFGRIIGTSNSSTYTGLHLKPTTAGANGQITIVVCEINFVFIGGFGECISLDCSTGNIAQNKIKGIEIGNGFGQTAGSMATAAQGVYVSVTSPNIFQGNEIDINYIQPYAAAFASGLVWQAIVDNGSSSLNNVNTWKYGAIDGAGYATSYGLNLFAGYNTFSGPIVDVQTGIQFESGASQYTIISQDINVISGGTRINDLSGVGNAAEYVGSAFHQSGITAQTASIPAASGVSVSVTFPYPLASNPKKLSATVTAPTGNNSVIVNIASYSSTGMTFYVMNLHATLAATAAVSYTAAC